MDELRFHLHDAGFIPSVALLIVCYALLRGARASMWRVALLSFPGTAAHELAHFIVGLLLRGKPHGLSLWPRADARGWRLGSVSFGHVGLFNGAWIALAPLLLLPLAWLGLFHVLLPLWAEGRWGWWLFAGYLTATALFAALPSFQDLKLGYRSLLFYALLGALAGFLFYTQR